MVENLKALIELDKVNFITEEEVTTIEKIDSHLK